MILSDYIKTLNDIFNDYGDVEVIYSSDDEGNDFRKVGYTPSAGNYSNFDEGQFIPLDQFNDYGDEDETLKVNSVCVN